MRATGPASVRSESRSRAGLRLHPEVRHGAVRRRWCEWERPHYVSWRPAAAGDAEWMSGKSRSRLAPVLTEAPSWMSDLSALGTTASARRSRRRMALNYSLSRFLVMGYEKQRKLGAEMSALHNPGIY